MKAKFLTCGVLVPPSFTVAARWSGMAKRTSVDTVVKRPEESLPPTSTWRRIEFLTEQIAILKSAKPWPGIADEIEERRVELRQLLISILP